MSAFFSYFIPATMITSVGILLILLVKKGFKKHISARWQYKLDLLFFVMLVLPFIPGGFSAYLGIGNWLNIFSFERAATINTTVVPGQGAGFANGMGWLQDFAVSVSRAAPEYLSMTFIAIWAVGIFTFTAIALLCHRKLRLVKESVKPVKDEEMLSLFLRCRNEIGVKGSILLGSSVLVKTPMTVGIFKTQIILPAKKVSLNDARYAMLHELVHCKNKDVLINGIMCLFQILYWFNPLVCLAFKQMRLDRELACDTSVLEILPEEAHINYGETLLNFASASSRPSVYFFTATMGGSKRQIIKRIEYIASYTAKSGMSKIKGICAFVIMGLIIFCLIPILSLIANDDDTRFHFHAENVLYQDFSSFFGGLEGSFVLYDVDAGLYIIHNRDKSITRVSPNSTYKIFSTLIALETGVLEAKDTFRQWNGALHPFDAWNQDHNLASAMRYSVNWYFQDLDAQVGIEVLRSYLTQLSYGNHNLSGGILDFWIESSLRISPIEQVRLLRDFYQDNTIFETEHINTLKEALRLSERNGAALSGETGTGFLNDGTANGWFIGYVENNEQDTAPEQPDEADTDFAVDNETQHQVDEDIQFNKIIHESEILRITRISRYVYQHTS